jgi:hypothetical protein
MQRWWRFGLPMVAGVSLLTAALADFLFYDQIVGWTLGGFVAWLLLLMLLRDGRKLLRGPRWAWGWALSLMTTGLCVSLVLEPGTIAVVLSLIMLTTLAMLAHGWRSRSLGWRWLGQLVMSWAMAISRPIRDSRLARKWAHRTQGLRSRAIGIAKWVWTFAGIFIPLLLSLVFLSLFALANPVVSDWMSRSADKVGDFFSNLTDYVTFGRILLWYAAAFACWGLLRHRPRRPSRIVKLGRNLITQVADLRPANATDETVDAHPINLAAAQKRAAQQESTEGDIEEAAAEPDKSTKEDVFAWLSGKYTNLIVRCLIAMNLVFALQLVLDSRYLVLGQDLPEGMSYAEYAHRGAYPLIATAILAAALVLAVFRPGGIAQRSKLAVWLVILWIAQNIVLVASAAWRLQAYVEVYTLTRLRVAAAVWMLMVAGCLALMLWRIARSRDNNWLTGWAMGWGIAVLWVCSFVPFDPLIANYNVRNCKEMGGEAGALDLAYLESLGPDALPAVAYLIENLPQEAASAPPAIEPKPSYGRGSRVEQIEYDEEGRVVAVKFVGLGEELAAMRDRLSDDLDEQLDGWRGWTVRRAWLDESVSD